MLKSAVESLWKWFRGWCHLGPHFVIGDPKNPYMLRWYILPRNPLFNVYLHKFLRNDDDDRALHDHPWPSLSLLVKGWVVEEIFAYPDPEWSIAGQRPTQQIAYRFPGIRFRS